MKYVDPRDEIAAGADAIGDHLCRTALWHGSSCNWFGRCVDELDETTRTVTPTVAALGGDLYEGSAGCGLFLALLAHRSGSGEHHRTALAALQRSLAVADRLDPWGFFTGRVGVAYAAAVGGRALDDEALVASGLALGRSTLACALVIPRGEEPLDVIGGLAGMVQGWLAIARIAGAADLVDGACTAAHRLAARGRRDDDSWCWRESAGPGEDGATAQPALTGMSHGAAGIGLALLEAHAVSSDGDLLAAARGAFRYENTRYVADQRNWLDLRPELTASEAPGGCGMTWCHGAPGIALARLRAIELCPGEPAWRDDAEAALASTRAELRRRGAQRGLDATPCHGTAGLGETLLSAGQLLGDAVAAEAEATAVAAATAWTSGDQSSGVPSGGPNPSLMIGSAGVGLFLLRALDPAGVPSVLGSPARGPA